MNERDCLLPPSRSTTRPAASAYLDQACGSDTDSASASTSCCERSPRPAASRAAGRRPSRHPGSPPGLSPREVSTESVGTAIGPYKLLQQIGEGGMGVVFMAEQTAAGPANGGTQDHQAGHGHAGRSSPASRPSGKPWR